MPKQVNFRLPDDCVEFLEAQSVKDASSRTSVLVRAIRAMNANENENRPSAETLDRFESKTA